MKIFFENNTDFASAKAYMYDYGQKFEIEGLNLPDNFEVHFSVCTGIAEPRKGELKDGIGIVEIPDSCFETVSGQFEAWIYLENENSGKTIKKITVYLEPREPASGKPQTHDIVEVKHYADIVKENADKVLEAEQATKAAVKATENAKSIADSVKKKLDNGEFIGPPGKDAVIDTILSPESSNAIANSTVSKVLSDGNLVGIQLISDYEQLIDVEAKYVDTETWKSKLKDDEYVIILAICDIYDEDGEYGDSTSILKKAMYVMTNVYTYEIGEVSADDISAIDKAINAVNKRLDDINIGKVNVTDFNETVEELRSPKTKLNQISVYLPDLPDGVYELESKYNPPLTKIYMSNVAGDSRHFNLNNGDIFALATDSEGIRSLNIFTALGSYFIYDINADTWDDCYCLTYGEASALIAEQIKTLKNSVNNDLKKTNTNVTEALTIAKGKNRALVFTTFQELNDWINGEFVRDDGKTTADLQVGDNLYIVEVGVPDFWWDGNTIQVLETQKVDLSEYAAKEHWIQLCDDTLEENVSYILKTTDEQGNPFKFKKAVIYIYTPIASATDSLIVKCSEIYNGTSESNGTIAYISNVINTSSSRLTIVNIDASTGMFIESSSSSGTNNLTMSNNLKTINTLYTAIEKLLIRTNSSNAVFPAGTRIRIWGC